MSDPMSSGPTILIAEDETELLVALQEMVENEGYRVVGAITDGLEAIAAISQLQPDLALLDYRLPGADGVAILQAIQRDSPNTQAVMFTAYDDTSLSLDATRAGAFAFLVKGCAPSLILQALESAAAYRDSLARRPG